MTQEKKQTAVEFYLEKDTVLTIAFLQNKDKISQLEFLKAKFEIFDKAIAMEREQIEEAVREGYDSDRTVKKWKWIGQEYYDETYGKEADNE